MNSGGGGGGGLQYHLIMCYKCHCIVKQPQINLLTSLHVYILPPSSHTSLQREQPHVPGLPKEAGVPQEVPEPLHAVLPPPPHAEDHAPTPAHLGHNQ